MKKRAIKLDPIHTKTRVRKSNKPICGLCVNLWHTWIPHKVQHLEQGGFFCATWLSKLMDYSRSEIVISFAKKSVDVPLMTVDGLMEIIDDHALWTACC